MSKKLYVCVNYIANKVVCLCLILLKYIFILLSKEKFVSEMWLGEILRDSYILRSLGKVFLLYETYLVTF
jgi:hypothetical protein